MEGNYIFTLSLRLVTYIASLLDKASLKLMNSLPTGSKFTQGANEYAA